MAEEFVKVTHCGDCPFSVIPNDITGYCSHPDADPENELYSENLDESKPIVPLWCPLAEKDILIHLTI